MLHPIRHLHEIRLADLRDVDQQKRRIEDNTRQFVAGRSANNVLLTGARGTGKSSLIKALLNQYAKKGLRLIEVDKGDLIDLPDIVDLVAGRPERFIVFCDDLSFESGEPGYKALKSVLDGSVAAVPDNVLIYATSNRRHLMPEYHDENLEDARTWTARSIRARRRRKRSRSRSASASGSPSTRSTRTPTSISSITG